MGLLGSQTANATDYVEVTIGNPDSTTRAVTYPFNYNALNNLAQVIYLQSELEHGYITSLTYRFTPVNPPNIAAGVSDVRIWMALTNDEIFATTSTWVPFDQFTLVYEGPINVMGPDTRDVEITLDEEFPYFPYFSTGNTNLVIMTGKKFTAGTPNHNTNNWHLTALQANRVLHRSATTDIHPPAPTAAGTRTGNVPNTKINIATPGGSIAGVVTNTINGTPVAGAEVRITGTRRHVFTNALGEYNINLLYSGAYSITVSKYMFHTQTITSVNVPSDGAIVQNVDFVQVQHDLVGVSLTGPTHPISAIPNTYTITVKNDGATTATGYLVRLMRYMPGASDVQLAEVHGISLDSEATHPFEITWTPDPAIIGPMIIYGLVHLDGDEFPENNYTINMNVTVQAEGTVLIIMGDWTLPASTSTSNNSSNLTRAQTYPFNFDGGNGGLSQTIYTQEEIGVGGYINQFVLRYDIGNNVIPPGRPVRFYVANTHLSNFLSTSSWVPYEEFTLIYEGDLDLPSLPQTLAHEVVIPFETPFFYEGSNLAIMSNRVSPPTGGFNANFWHVTFQGVNSHRTLRALGPIELPFSGFPITGLFRHDHIPNARIHFNTLGLGSISGTVTEAGSPFENVEIKIDGTLHRVFTDQNGAFTLNYIRPGTHTLIASKFMYFDVVVQNVVVTAGENTTVPNIAMIAIDHDLVAVSLTGANRPTVGVSTTYSIDIRNDGGLTATGYSVRLMRVVDGADDEILETVAGIPLTTGASHTFHINWAPAIHGVYDIYGFVDFTADQAPANNRTSPLTLDVLMAGTSVTVVGNWAGTTVDSSAAFDYQSRNTVNQTIYLASELPTNGLITKVMYRLNVAVTAPTVAPERTHVRLYMAPTSLASFATASSWVPYNQFTLVYDGELDIHAIGNNQEIVIELDRPFHHQGGNLVLMHYRPWDPIGWFAGRTWHRTTTPANTNRAIRGRSDTNRYNLSEAYPPSGDNSFIQAFANIQLFIYTRDWGTLAGTVSNAGVPISDARVSIDGTSLYSYSDASGWYRFDHLYPLPKTVDITATKPRFFDYKKEGISVSTSGLTDYNIAMTPFPVVTVSGRIISSDTNSGLAGANITLEGFEDYIGITTNSEGIFIIPGVFANFTYRLTVSYHRYQTHIDNSLIVGASDHVIGDIMLYERTEIPRNLVAEKMKASVLLTWEEPIETADYWFGHNVGTMAGGIGSTMPTVFSKAHRYTPAQLADMGVAGAYLTKVIFGIRSLPNINNVTIQIYNGGSWSPINPGTLVHEQDVPWVNLVEDVNEVSLTEDVSIPTDSELWIVIRADVNVNGLIGRDANTTPGVLVGYANVIHFNGVWTTLNTLGDGIHFNFAIKGFAERATEKGTFAHNTSSDNRVLTGYNIYRANVNDIGDKNEWERIATNVTGLTYTDNSWNDALVGEYRYAIVAVYTNSNFSKPTFSNVVEIIPEATVYITIFGEGDESVEGAMVRLENNYEPEFVYSQIAVDNVVVFPVVQYGYYTLFVAMPGYTTYINTNLTIEQQVVEHSLDKEKNYAILYEDFGGFVFPPTGWTTKNHDQSEPPTGSTKGWHRHTGIVELPNIVCMPHTAPAMAGSRSINDRYAGANVDQWLITKQVEIPVDVRTILRYFVRAASTENRSHYEVLISTSDTDVGVEEGQMAPIGEPGTEIGSWTSIYRYLPEGDAWSVKIHDLSEYAGQTIYIAFRHKDNIQNGEWVMLDTVTLSIDLVFNYGSIAGKVTDSESKPIQGVRISVSGTHLSSTTDEYGEYFIDYITPSRVIITAEKEGYVRYSSPRLFIMRDRTLTHDIRMDATVDEADIIDEPFVTALDTNFPNPFNPSTTIRFSIENAGNVLIDVYNLRGQFVKTLVNEHFNAGQHRVMWNGTDSNGRTMSSGIYFYRMTSGEFIQTRKMILMK
jgi:hypothetical protein